MPLLTTAAILLLKKFAIKGGIALTSGILKELATNSQIAHALESLAQDMGMEAGKDAVDFLLESFDTVGELLDELVDFLSFGLF